MGKYDPVNPCPLHKAFEADYCPGCGTAARIPHHTEPAPRRLQLTMTLDVTGFTGEQIEWLVGEIMAQTNDSDEHPDCGHTFHYDLKEIR